ncbi:MAG: hypothetical protein ACRDKT_18395 [Actinomycetota bacterium]
MKAYVLVQTTSEAGAIAADLRTVPGVVSADDLQGPYDAIALTRSDHHGDDLAAILDAFHELPGVTRAVVAPLVRSAGRDGVQAA